MQVRSTLRTHLTAIQPVELVVPTGGAGDLNKSATTCFKTRKGYLLYRDIWNASPVGRAQHVWLHHPFT